MSDNRPHTESDILPYDMDVGGDADQGGIAQPVSQAEVDDIINDQTMPVEERVARLQALMERLGIRDNADRGDEMDPLGMQLSEALNMLAEGGHAYGTMEAEGFDPESRSDARSPDDDLNLDTSKI